MNTIKNILAIIDPTAESQKALARACELANKTGAHICAFLSIYDFSYEMTTMLSLEERDAMREAVIKDRTEWLNELIRECDCPHQITSKVVWHNRPFEAIIHTVFDGDFDIIVKGTHEHHTLKAVIFTPTDWHLIRKAPCPVLLVKDHAWPEQGNVIAAINAASDDEQHLALNKRIIKDAQFICDIAKGHLHLVNAYPSTPLNVAIEIPEFNPNHYNDAVKKHHLEGMQAYAAQFGVGESHCHVKEGLPEDVLPFVADELDAELVVMGTVGRTGLSAALIGNTAEHVIDRLNCDVLALKPDGYVSPMAKTDD